MVVPHGKVSPPRQENEDQGINQHQPGEHEELRGLLIEQLGLGHQDDDDVAKCDSEEPGGLHHGLHGGGGLAVGELQARHGEHHLAGRDDEVLGDLPEDVDGVWRGESVEDRPQPVGLRVPGHHQAVHSALLHPGGAQLVGVQLDPDITMISGMSRLSGLTHMYSPSSTEL